MAKALRYWLRKYPNRLQRLALSLLLLLPLNLQAQTPTLHASTDIATAGYFQLDWQAEAATARFQLEERRVGENPHIIYEGSDTASLISGRSDGEYRYRLRVLDKQPDSPWSDTVSVRVEHHPLSRALSFFAIGFLVFAATLLAILRGAKNA